MGAAGAVDTGTSATLPLTGGRRNDATQLIPLLDTVPPIRGVAGKPRRRCTDRGYDHDKYRRLVRARGIHPLIARRGVEHGSGLGKIRRPVEHTSAWLIGFRRLRIRTERRAGIHQAILSLACAIICLRELILN
ncbi:transposase [Amycolatopsis sp. YIM 10]|uniref:transposase n=1 Tax=Amycolatopsis sp. YIM 10 TaxID=2653857 RepID=UPI00128FE979|nr:transposase [Amycolatopsis sp. YIM 10]